MSRSSLKGKLSIDPKGKLPKPANRFIDSKELIRHLGYICKIHIFTLHTYIYLFIYLTSLYACASQNGRSPHTCLSKDQIPAVPHSRWKAQPVCGPLHPKRNRKKGNARKLKKMRGKTRVGVGRYPASRDLLKLQKYQEVLAFRALSPVAFASGSRCHCLPFSASPAAATANLSPGVEA